MIPYSDLVYFLAVLVLLVPMLVASRLGKGASAVWLAIATAIMMCVEFSTPLHLTASVYVPELFAVVFFGIYQLALVKLALKFKAIRKNVLLISLSLIPIVVAKYVPAVFPDFHFGFVGISYVTFRSLDVIWSITDGVLMEVGTLDPPSPPVPSTASAGSARTSGGIELGMKCSWIWMRACRTCSWVCSTSSSSPR